MDSFAVKSYWKCYDELPKEMRKQADAKFELWKENPFHPSLHFKCVNSEDNIWSALCANVIETPTPCKISVGWVGVRAWKR